MVGKNNQEILNKKTGHRVNRYGIRRLSVGVASVAVAGLLFASNAALVQAADGVEVPTTVETTEANSEEGNDTGVDGEAAHNSAADTGENTSSDKGLSDENSSNTDSSGLSTSVYAANGTDETSTEDQVETRDVSVNIQFVTLDREFLNIPNAKAVATNKETGDTFEFVMTDKGEIPHLQLPLGDYELKITEVPEEFLEGKNYEDWKTVTKSFTVVSGKNVGETIGFYEKEPEVEKRDVSVNVQFVTLDRQFLSIPNAKAVATNKETGDTFEFVMTDKGEIPHLQLPLGDYELKITEVPEEFLEGKNYEDWKTVTKSFTVVSGKNVGETIRFYEKEPEELNDYKLHIYHYSELVETKDYDQVTLEDFDAAVAAVIEQAIAG